MSAMPDTRPPNTRPSDTRPIIAVTMGDASGIGPEIIMKALARDDVAALCRPLVVGDATRLREAGAVVRSALAVNALRTPAEARYARGAAECIDLGLIPAGHPFGTLSPVSGEAAYRYIERATRLVQAGEADAIAFGRPFISNPDLVERFRTGAPLAEDDMKTWYSQGPEGYVDYPALERAAA